MEKTILNSMLFDFYGELLPEKQRLCYSLQCNEDYSLTEIAEEMGISRQAAWDYIRKAQESMLRFEEKTGLVARFSQRKKIIDEIYAHIGNVISQKVSPEQKAELDTVIAKLEILSE